jgi:NADH-quinone oxidoreductase subunit M
VTIHLSILVFVPLVFGLLAALAPARLSPVLLLGGTAVTLVYAVLLLFDFDTGAAQGLQYVTDDAWIPDLGVRYTLGVDGLNLWLIALTALISTASALWIAIRPVADRPRLFAFHLGLAETAVLGAFVAQDLILFVLFFDLMLVPFYFLVGQWGGEGRVAATFKMVVYTLVGSLLMLAAAVATGVITGAGPDGATSFSIQALAENPMSDGTQRWMFAAFALAFLIKMPSFPFHGWMPDAYRTMPLPALALFSGVLSKVAAYGFLRVALPVFPGAAEDFQMVIMILALLSIIYGSALAFTVTNARLILGYSSVAQLGFITLGIFALLHERTGSDDIRDMGGVAFRAPVLATLFLIVALATLAIPGSANFMGEFYILLGVFQSKLAVAIIASTGVALASVYMLRAFIRMMHNRLHPGAASFDLRVRDGLVLVPLVAAIVAFGVYPQQALEDSAPSAERVAAIAGGNDEALAQEATP